MTAAVLNRRPRRPGTVLVWVARHSIAIALCVMFIGPVVLLTLTSFMSSNQALTADLVPDVWPPDNYLRVFSATPLPRYLLNPVVYAGLATVFMLLSSVPA